MTPQLQQFLKKRAAGLVQNARRHPECAPLVRNWIELAVRCAENNGALQLASEIRRVEQGILEV